MLWPMVIIYDILVFIDKNFHTYLVRDPYAFGNVMNYWWIIWSFHNNQSCPVLGWSTLLASMAVTALYRQAIQKYCLGDKYLNFYPIIIWLDIHSKDQFKVMIEKGKMLSRIYFEDIFSRQVDSKTETSGVSLNSAVLQAGGWPWRTRLCCLGRKVIF